ncbi:MAG: DUF1552 domain-containing protein [Phycisphaerales bacterium]|nr:DUF1552 domain-containing protein [Phycisphaerales bacterium]
MAKTLHRRTVLRGIGTAIALPWLEAMSPGTITRSARAAARGTGPTRLAFLFVPNGVHAPEWLPSPETPGASSMPVDLPPLLRPLDRVREHITLHSGLSHRNATALGDGPGDHARSAACFLTGSHPRKTAGSDIVNGVSIDQAIASGIRGRTRFDSLELGCDPTLTAGNCDSGYSCAYSANIAWRSPRTPVAKETNPRAVFERLFMAGPMGESKEARARRLGRRQSILDAVRSDAVRLSRNLGGRDRAKLEEYLDGARELERRIEQVERSEQDSSGWGIEHLPDGVPGDYEEHLSLMGDLMTLAFRLDLTRVCTFMWANEGSNRTFPMVDVRQGHHHLSHHAGDEAKIDAIRRINLWQNERFADLVSGLAAVEGEDGGSLLDDTLVLYGGAISDGNRHNHHDLPIVVAGGGGAARPGRLISHAPRTPLCNLYQSMASAAGTPMGSFGDSNGSAML